MKAPVEDIDHIGQRLLQRFVFSIHSNWKIDINIWWEYLKEIEQLGGVAIDDNIILT
jgi:hypothetical protein